MSFKVKLPTMELGAVYDHSFLYWLQDTDGNRTPADLTGYEAEMDIYKGTTKIATLSTADGTIELSGNRVRLIIGASVTKLYTAFTEGDYDLLLIPGGDRDQARRLIHGKIPAEKVFTQLV